MKKRKSAVFDVVGYIVLLLIVLIVVLPLFWLIVSSFKSDADVIKWPPHFFPSEWVATAVPLRHESDPGAWHAQKYGNLRRMRDGNQSVF